MPSVTWYGSPNFTPGRVDVEYIVIHWMDGYLTGADATFQNAARQTSAHYGIEDDVIHQYVDEANTAWHAGNYDANQRSIGIEHSAMPGRPASDATYASTIWLIAGICQRYGLDPAVAILPHQHFTSTDCPGTMDLPRIIAGVQAALGGGVTTQSGTVTPITKEWFEMALDDQAKADIKELLLEVAKAGDFGRFIGYYVWNETPIQGFNGSVSAAARVAGIDQLTNTMGTAVPNALVSIAKGVGELKNRPSSAAPIIDVPALAAQIAAALNTNQAHDFLVAFRNALPAN